MPEPIYALQNALLDINWLLIEGFDQNIINCDIGGIRETIDEIIEVLKENGKEEWFESIFEWELGLENEDEE